MHDKGIFLVPTDYPAEFYATALGTAATPEERASRLAAAKPFVARSADRLTRAIKGGVRIAYGSDEYYNAPGRTRGQSSLLTLQAYQEAGMAPIDVIRAATINAADLLGSRRSSRGDRRRKARRHHRRRRRSADRCEGLSACAFRDEGRQGHSQRRHRASMILGGLAALLLACAGQGAASVPSRRSTASTLYPTPDLGGVSGEIALLPARSPFGVAVTVDGRPRHHLVATIRGLPDPKSLGPFTCLRRLGVHAFAR